MPLTVGANGEGRDRECWGPPVEIGREGRGLGLGRAGAPGGTEAAKESLTDIGALFYQNKFVWFHHFDWHQQ